MGMADHGICIINSWHIRFLLALFNAGGKSEGEKDNAGNRRSEHCDWHSAHHNGDVIEFKWEMAD